MHRLLTRQLRKLGIVEAPTEQQWSALLERVDRAYTEADQDRYTLERALELSSTEMRRRFNELREAQRALIEASRRAGMADAATGVLHNIGNVLNSVNVSITLLSGWLRQSPRAGLGKSIALVRAQPRPGAFIDDDPRGKKVLPYLEAVDRALDEEHTKMVGELESLVKQVDHLKAIINDQLASTRQKNQCIVLERARLDELIRDVIELSEVKSRGANLVCELEPLMVEVDRHKLTQIVVNLLRNAHEAIAATGRPGTITVRAQRGPSCQVEVQVRDDGVGVSKEVMDRIFNHGFTTKEHGNGFGLHHSACTAMELGGALTCASDGQGTGASFTLRFPRKRGATADECSRLSIPAAAPEALP
jgi:two-component system, LuxR family, sensor kinase FixL